MADILSEAELRKVLEEKLREAFKLITQEVYQIFMDKYVIKYVYGGHGANVAYYDFTREPTGQFANAWEWSEFRKVSDRFFQELWYNYETMDVDEDTYLHGSNYWSQTDMRKELPRIFDELIFPNFSLTVERKDPFWTTFIEDMFNSGKLKKIMNKHFLSIGCYVT